MHFLKFRLSPFFFWSLWDKANFYNKHLGYLEQMFVIYSYSDFCLSKVLDLYEQMCDSIKNCSASSVALARLMNTYSIFEGTLYLKTEYFVYYRKHS